MSNTGRYEEPAEPGWILRAAGVGCIYPDTEGLVRGAVNGVFVEALEIPAGGVTAIVGLSGSGKSTLLGLLSGLRKVNHQTKNAVLHYKGRDGHIYDLLRNEHAPASEVTFVFQDAQLIKAIPAKLNAQMGARLAGATNFVKRIAVLAEQFEVASQMDTLSETLSGGQAQRISVIRALAASPNLLICDEPTSSLDEKNGALVMEQIRKLSKELNYSVLWVTHNVSQTAQFADRVILVANSVVVGLLISDEPGEVFYPCPLDEDDQQENESFLRDFIELGRGRPRLTEETLDYYAQNTTVATRWIAPEPLQRLNTPRLLSNVSVIWLMIACGLAELKLFFRRAQHRGYSRLTASLINSWKTVVGSISLIMVLGLLVFYSVELGRSATEAALTAQLNQPALSHFTIAEKRNSGWELNGQTLVAIQETLAQRHTMLGLDAERSTTVFGRYEDPILKIWFPDQTEDGTCNSYPLDAPYNTSQITFDANEPLYAGLELRESDDSKVKGTLEQITDPSGLIVTQTFMERFKLDSVDMLCVDLFGPAAVPVLGRVDRLPGGGDRQFNTGLLTKTYIKVFSQKRPPEYVQDGKLLLPTFSNIAVYFSSHTAESVICAFEGVEDCAQLADAPQLAGFKPDPGSLKQIRGLLGSIRGARIAFGLLALSFTLTIAVSTALALAAFVRQNEKSIAVMKAFGFSYWHVLIMVMTKIYALLGVAVFVAAGLASLFSFGVAGMLEAAFSLPGATLAFEWRVASIAVLYLFALVTLVSMAVLGAWWKQNRYVAETLQTI